MWRIYPTRLCSTHMPSWLRAYHVRICARTHAGNGAPLRVRGDPGAGPCRDQDSAARDSQ